MSAHSTVMVAGTMATAADGPDLASEVVRSLPILLDQLFWRMLDPTGLISRLPTRFNRRFDGALSGLRRTVDLVIEHYRSHAIDNNDLLSHLIETAEADDRLTDLELRDHVMLMLIGGTESAGAIMAWTLHVLGGHPGVQRRVRDEVDSVCRGRSVEFDDLPKLEYTRRVITEVMRLYPPVWMMTRYTACDTELGGHPIPSGTTVVFFSYALHHAPALHPDPDTFDPDRWLAVNHQRRSGQSSFIPFGAGARGCTGEPLAWAEMLTTIATIICRWEFSHVDYEHVKPRATVTLRPTGLQLRAKRRSTTI